MDAFWKVAFQSNNCRRIREFDQLQGARCEEAKAATPLAAPWAERACHEVPGPPSQDARRIWARHLDPMQCFGAVRQTALVTVVAGQKVIENRPRSRREPDRFKVTGQA